MSIEFTRWPSELATKYREKGYWLGLPLCDIISRQKDNPAVAVIDGERQITYQELDRRSSVLATALYKQGVRQGDTALVQLGNTAELYVVYFALLKLGAVLVNALFSHRQHELDSYAQQIQPKLLVGDRQNPLFKDNKYLDHLRTISPQLSVAVFCNDGLEALTQEGGIDESVLNSTAADEVAFFNLSGGSTGTPKLIPRTHNDYYYSVRRSVDVCQFDESTRYLCAIPAAHNFPMSSPGALGVFYAGGQVVLAPDPSASSCFPLIQRHKVTVAALVPPAASLWLQEVFSGREVAGEPAKNALTSLELLQVGGARLSPTLAARLVEHLEIKLQQVFGMAEGLVCYTRLDDDEKLVLTTQGLPMSEADEVWAADDEGKPVAPGQVGVLMTQGPYTFRGYYKAPEHNAKSFDSKGFYCSGDLIAIADDGRITIHGRQKDQINRGGEKISTEEIENLLLRHPHVVEAGLVAMDDDLMGEKSVAFIMTAAPVKTAQLRKFLREQGVAEYKLPDKFSVLEEMPLTAVGKVDKKELRKLLSQQA